MSYFDTIYTEKNIPHRAKTVYMYLRSMATSKGVCWPGIRTIAADLSLSRSTVKRALADLESWGYIEKTHRFRDNGSYTSNLYTMKEPGACRQATTTLSDTHSISTMDSPGEEPGFIFSAPLDRG